MNILLPIFIDSNHNWIKAILKGHINALLSFDSGLWKYEKY